MCQTLRQEKRTARKKHRCIWCWQLIHPGEVYWSSAVVDGSDFWVQKFHPECLKAMEEYVVEEGPGCVHWMPGEFDRPYVDNWVI